MMEKLSSACEARGCTPPPFTISTIAYKVVEYAPAERTDTYTTPISTLLLYVLRVYKYDRVSISVDWSWKRGGSYCGGSM